MVEFVVKDEVYKKKLDRLENKLKFGILLNRFMQYSEMHEIFLEKCLTN